MELFCEASERLKAVNYFRKKAPEYVFGWVLNTLLRLNIENYSDPQNESVKFQVIRGGSRAAATSKMERFVIIVNGFQPLTIITKSSILDVAAFLDLPLVILMVFMFCCCL